jgi:hypothetical protein
MGYELSPASFRRLIESHTTTMWPDDSEALRTYLKAWQSDRAERVRLAGSLEAVQKELATWNRIGSGGRRTPPNGESGPSAGGSAIPRTTRNLRRIRHPWMEKCSL